MGALVSLIFAAAVVFFCAVCPGLWLGNKARNALLPIEKSPDKQRRARKAQDNEIMAAYSSPNSAKIANALLAEWRPGGYYYNLLYCNPEFRTKINKVVYSVEETFVTVQLDSTLPVGDPIYMNFPSSEWKRSILLSDLCRRAGISTVIRPATHEQQWGISDRIANVLAAQLTFLREEKTVHRDPQGIVFYSRSELWISW